MQTQISSLCWLGTRATCGICVQFRQKKLNSSQVRLVPSTSMRQFLLTYEGENNLSFIETSALDASNVELAFQNILTGEKSGRPFTTAVR